MSRQTASRTVKMTTDWCTLDVSTISLMLCMLSRGCPTSRVGMPSFAEEIGPMVLPQAMSCRITKS